MSNQILVNTSTLSPLADAVRTATGATNTMSAAETIAKSTTIVENGGSAVASVNGKIGVVALNYTDVGAPPSSRTINGKSLEEDIILTAQDVGAPTTEDAARLETQVTTNTTAIGTLDSRTGNHALAIEALQNEVDEHTLQSEMMFLQRDRVSNLVDNSDFSIWFGGAPIENALTITEGPTKWYGNGNLYRTYSQISKGCRITTNTSGTYVGIQQRVPATKLHTGAYTIIWNFTTSADCVSYQRNTITANTPTTEIIYATITDEHITQGYYSLGSCGIYSLADGSDIPEGFYFDVENVAMYEGTYTLDNYPTYIKPNTRLEAIKCDVPMNPRNLLDNSWFVNPVHQRGATEYTGLNTYTIDRWYVGGTNNKVTIGYGCVKAETTVGSSYATIAQKVANCTQYAGKTLTFAAYVRSNVIPRIYAYNGDTGIKSVEGVSGDYQVLVCSFTVPANISDGALIVKLQGKSTGVGDYIEVKWAALYKGFYTADTLPAYVVPNKRIEMIRCGVPMNPQNLLDNSWFVNPINQRGQTQYTGSAFTVDRWRTWNDSATITLTSDGVKGDGTDASVLYQGIELHKIKLGTAYTVAVGYSDGTISCDAGTLTTSGGAGIWNNEAQLYLAWGDGSPFVRLWHATKTIQWAAIYPGAYTAETLPEYHYKGYAAELAECQRYYINTTNVWMMCHKIRGWGPVVEIPANMRIAPTVLIDSTDGVCIYDNTSTWISTNVSYTQMNSKSVFIILTDVDNTEFGESLLTKGIIGLSADL